MATQTFDRNPSGFYFGMQKTCKRSTGAALAIAPEIERHLAAHEFLALPDGELKVTCLEGEFWLTRDGDIEDYILGPGRSFTVRRGDRATMQALKPGRIRLT